MLHYYVKDFFNSTVLSAYKNDRHVVVYYIDHLYHKTKDQHMRGKFHVIDDQLQDQIKYKFDQLQMKEEKHDSKNDIIKENTLKYGATKATGDNIKMTMTCYHWSSMAPAHTVNTSFSKVKQIVTFNYMRLKVLVDLNHARLSRDLSELSLHASQNGLILSNMCNFCKLQIFLYTF